MHVISWNVNGLNGQIKRTACLDLLRRQHVDVAFIQESHLRTIDVRRFSNKHYHVAASASLDIKTRGSLVVLRRNLPITVLGQFGSEDGRISYIKTIISGRKFAFISVYAPSQYEPEFFPRLTEVLLHLQDFSLILGADMNCYANVILDKSTQRSTATQLQASKDFQKFLSTLSLTDLYRSINPTSKQYTFYSARHQSFSRIDYILTSATSLSEIHDVVIEPCSLSDHNIVAARFTLLGTPPRAPRWRFNVSLLKNDDFCTFLKEKLNFFIDVNAGSVDDPRFLWDAIKGCIRDSSISFSSHLNKSRLKKITELENALAELEVQQQSTYSDAVQGRIAVTKTELNSLLRRRAEFLMHRTRRTYYFNGARPSHLLALRLKSHEKYSNITAIETPSRTLSNPIDINSEFKSFYSSLYKSEISLDRQACADFFQDLNLPSLSDNESESLNTPISLEELRKALVNMKKGKSPGWDGIPPELYLTFWDILGRPLLDMINMAIDKGAFNSSTNTAIITVLPKPNKDPTKCGNYRPLSLLNGDVKLYAKVLATRLEIHLTKLIHNDQTGFIRTRLASDNVRRLLHIIHASSSIDSPCSVLSLDAEKAFDRLEWECLWTTLDRFGLGLHYINMVKVLYANPSAMVCTGHVCSAQFPILRGTRQGCPLSPLLFALSLEPLAQKIRLHPSVHSITFCNTEHRISLYADDILLYVGSAGSSIPHLFSSFDMFSSLSGYKINWNKSALMHLNSAAHQVPLPSHIPVVKSFKYLGIQIFPSTSSIAIKNFQGIYSQIERDFERWSNLPNSLQARIAIIKMDILPRVNFYSSMIPLAPPLGYWDRLQSLVSKFIWKGKRPRIKLTTLQRDKNQGGLALPDFKIYSWSYVLRPLSTWFDPSSAVSWRPVEENIALPHRLQDLVYANIPLKKAKLRLGPVISFLLASYRTAMRHVGADHKWHNHTPIFNNFSLLTGNMPFSFPHWKNRGVNILKDLFNVHGLRAFNDLQVEFGLPGSSFFFYMQLRSAMRAYGVPWGVALPTHPLRKLLASIGPTRGMVSKLYKFLSGPYKSLPVEGIWNRDLNEVNDREICWDTVWKNLSGTSKNPNHQLIHYKYVNRMYLTPRRRYAMKIATSPNCDLCPLNVQGSFLHVYWECPGVVGFWKEISLTLSDILKIKIPVSPALLLLNDDSSLILSLQHRRILWAGLTAAKKMLALRWQPPHSLAWQQWANSFLEIVLMEWSVARMHGANHKTLQGWEAAHKLVKERVQHGRS